MFRNILKVLLSFVLRRRKILLLCGLLLGANSFISVIFQALIYVDDANAYAIQVNMNSLQLNTDQSALHTPLNTSLSQPGKHNTAGPLLTLFTSFKDIPKRLSINKMTIDVWAKLPRVKAVMYTELSQESPLALYALKNGWSVYPAPSLRKGYPVLKDMYLYTINRITPSTPFVAYANSDILFTSDLLDTLEFLSHLSLSYLSKRGLLASGRRINTLVERIQERASRQHMRNLHEVEFDTEDAIDYFLTTRDGYPWEKVPDFVIGKPGYDNWLLKKAVEWDLLSIDVSLTVSALHQTYNSTHADKGWLSKDVCMNRDLVDQHGFFPYYMGRTSCLKYFTDFRQNHVTSANSPTTRQQTHSGHRATGYQGDVDLFQRQAMTRWCYPPLALPIIGVRWYKGCAQLARTKTVQSEKYKYMAGGHK